MIGKIGRFEPQWGWRQRFSLDELKEIYLKLFRYDWFHDMQKPASENIQYRHYEVGSQKRHGHVVLKDGGRARIEFITLIELDWFLYNGYDFGFYTQYDYVSVRQNPLYHILSREEALVALDLSGISLALKNSKYN